MPSGSRDPNVSESPWHAITPYTFDLRGADFSVVLGSMAVHRFCKGCAVSRISPSVEGQTDPSRTLPNNWLRVGVREGAYMPQPANQNRAIKTAIPGPKSQAIRSREDAHLAPGAQGYALMAGVVVDHAEGTSITDVDGNVFLDFIGGIAVGALG